MKCYRVEALAQASTTWEPIYYTDSLPVAKRYAAAMVKSQHIQAAQVVKQITEQVVASEQA